MRRDKPGHDERRPSEQNCASTRSIATVTPGGSQRQLRVGELIRHAMADMLTRGDVHDPVLEGHLITVPEVRMSADLRLATIYVMPLGGRDIEAGARGAGAQQALSARRDRAPR